MVLRTDPDSLSARVTVHPATADTYSLVSDTPFLAGLKGACGVAAWTSRPGVPMIRAYELRQYPLKVNRASKKD